MKLPCELVRDILPLYHDGVCSEISKTLVNAHLDTCEDCARFLNRIDAEIEVPKVEGTEKEGLASIKKAWKRSKVKSFLLGLTITTIAAGALWWLLFEWYCVTVTPGEMLIRERSILSNGRTVLEYAVPYPDKYPHQYITEDGIKYTWYQRPLFWDQIENPGGTTSYWDPDEQYWLSTETQTKVTPVAWYFGKPDSDDLVLFWERDMELPPASQSKEEQYQQLQDAFAAPNAPEKPEVLTVVEAPSQDQYWDSGPSDAIEETSVSSSDPTSYAEYSVVEAPLEPAE